MLSDFRRRKLIGLFRFNDLDGDGKITEEDFDRVMSNYAQIYGVAPDSPELEDLSRRYHEQWTQLQAFDGDGDGAVGLEEYLAGSEAWIADRAAFEASIDAMIGAFYAIVDRDKDGRVSEEELSLNWRAHGLEESSARVTFAKLDRDGDGKVTKDEMVNAVLETYFSEDPEAPGNWIALPEG